MARASYELVVLSSSPPAPEAYAPSSPLNANYRPSPRRVAMRATPSLTPSPPVSPQKRPSGASALGSRKAPIPPDAIRGFATVGSLVRSEHFAPQLDDHLSELPQAQSRTSSVEDVQKVSATTKKPRKRSTTAAAADGDAKPKPKPRARKPKADSDKPARDPELRLPAPKISPFFPTEDAQTSIEPPIEPADAATKLTKSGKLRKPRMKKEKVEGEGADAKPKKARIAKPKGTTKAVGRSQREDAFVESAHFRKGVERDDDLAAHELAAPQAAFNQDAGTADAAIWEVPESPKPKKKRAPKQRPPDPVVESLDLDEAVSRRRDWTPPKDTAIASPFTDSAGKENKQIESDANAGQFTHMVSNFAYAQSPSTRITVNTAPSTTEVVAVTKRRRVEVSI